MRINTAPTLPNQELNESDPEHKKLRETCRDFEAVMVSLVLKEGLNGASEMGATPGVDDEEDSGTKAFKQFAYEQMSYCIGKTGLLGLGDNIYAAMKGRLDLTPAKKGSASQDAAAPASSPSPSSGVSE